MCKLLPNDHARRAGRAPSGHRFRWWPVAGIAAALLAALLPAYAGVAATPAVEPAPALARALPVQTTTAGGYQLRCWQHGRLLFEENNVALPTDNPRYALRLSGNDGQGRPIYVAETQNATCLVRFQPVALNPALPH